MLETRVELVLKDISRRIHLLMDQVSEGELVDNNLLEKLNEVSEQVYIKHTAGYDITDSELDYMTDLVDLLEMRTTLIYRNPPKK
jgi:hypothetical protein